MRQAQALQIMLSGDSVFLTGAPGAGTTYVLNQFVKRAERTGKRVAVTASTGIAATHIGGTTLHSWSGLGIRDQLSSRDREGLKNNDRRSPSPRPGTWLLDAVACWSRFDTLNGLLDVSGT